MIRNIHPKYIESLELMALDLTIDLPFYAEFNNAVNFFESNKIKTAGVNVTEAGMNHYYSPEFLKSLTQKEDLKIIFSRTVCSVNCSNLSIIFSK